MKRRLICLALCLVLVLSVCLTGCKEKTTEEMQQNIMDQASEDTVTLTMWMVTEQPLTDAVKESVESAVNRITTSKFNTYMDINFLTEDKYYDEVSAEILQNEDARNEFAPVKLTASDPFEYGYGDENDKTDIFKKRYPGVVSHQVDIVYIAGEEMYKEYVDNGWLMALDTELSGSSKKIGESISATLLKAAKVYNNGINATYAIPNNRAIGEYTYMLIDKELADATSLDGIYNLGKIDGFFNEYIYYYLEDIAKNYEGVIPIAAKYKDCLNLLAHYWSIDPDTYEAENDVFSVLGYRYTDPKTLSKGQTVLSFDSLFADEVFCDNLIKLKEYDVNNYFGEPAEGQKSAIKFATGDITAYDEYLKQGYYPVIVKYPTANVEDVYESMFGVCSYTVDLARSMQILTYLNTNADLRNLLQYGVEGEHYNLIEDENGVKRVVRLTDENKNVLYAMDIFKTGNAFVAYPDSYMDEDVWEIAKKQNLQALMEPLLNFDFAQIVKDAAGGNEDAPSVGSKGYVYTYSSGYSKEVASEHKYLKTWIDNCDKMGKGVYVLHTGTLDGQDFAGKIYYYNNNIVGATVTVTDGGGALHVNYEGTVGEGSDVTVINFNGKKVSGNLAWNASVNGTKVHTAVTHRNADVTHDFMDTENYTVDLDTNVTKTMISDNKIIWNWIVEVSDKIRNEETQIKNGELQTSVAPTQEKIHVAAFKNEEEGASSYTYAFYLPRVYKNYSVSAHPTVANGLLNVALSYQNSTSDLADDAVNYAIFILNIDVKTPIESAVLTFTVDGETVNVDGENVDEKIEKKTLEADPKINISGDLNTIALTYFAMINEKVNGMLNRYDEYIGKTVEEITEKIEAMSPSERAELEKALGIDPEEDLDVLAKACYDSYASYDNYVKTVRALNVLLTPTSLDVVAGKIAGDADKQYKFSEHLYGEAYEDLPEAFKVFLKELDDGEKFYVMLAYMTTAGEITRYKVDLTNQVLATKQNSAVYDASVSNDTRYKDQEDYYSYKSPYALYLDWLKKTGYEIKK